MIQDSPAKPAKSQTRDFTNTSNMASAPDGGWGWVCVAGGSICFFVLGGFPMSFSLIYQQLLQRFQCSQTEASWVYALYSIMAMTTGKYYYIL